MQHKYIIKSLPLLASILGRKYGIEVRIGGSGAYTNGRIIQLPSLPLDGGETLLGLVRGMLDHEAAHIRHTDFEALKASGMSALEKHIWNIFEDWRAENRMSALYPGCRDNFQWLIRHMFLQQKDGASAEHTDPAMLIPAWLLITVRSWDLAALAGEMRKLQAAVEKHYPGLVHELEPLLHKAKANCVDTADAIELAREVVSIIKKYLHSMQQPGFGLAAAICDSSGKVESGQAINSLQDLLAATEDALPQDVGSRLQAKISASCHSAGERMRVAVPTEKAAGPLSEPELDSARRASTALRTRLQGLLQSARLVRNCSGYSGTIDTRHLHSLATGNSRVFLRRGEKSSVNTAVHMLLDASGSMSGGAIRLAGQACFAVASALQPIKGISVGVSAFPGGQAYDELAGHNNWDTVCRVLSHGERLHQNFALEANGGTPMASALWWTLQHLHPRPEERKIILLVTDGEPDHHDSTVTAITAIRSLGLEIYGIGIATNSITHLLPGKASRQIGSLHELVPAMFDLLHDALAGRQRIGSGI